MTVNLTLILTLTLTQTQTLTLGMCMPRDAIKEGQRVLVIDDLVATGGTLSSAIELVQMAGGVVVECACIVELKFLIPSRKELYEKVRKILYYCLVLRQSNLELDLRFSTAVF